MENNLSASTEDENERKLLRGMESEGGMWMWFGASQLCSRWWPLRLETRRERTRGGINLG